MVSTPFVAVPPRGYGGTELVVFELVRGLEACGHEVTLFATGDSSARDLRYVYRDPVWPPEPDAEVYHCAAAARSIARGRFDVVHAHAASMLTLPGDLGAPLVYTVHHDHQERLTNLYLRRPATHFVAISRRQAELERPLACRVVHHGLDPARYPAGDGAGGYALFLGRLSPGKGPDAAIAAARAAGLPIHVAGEIHRADGGAGWAERLATALAGPGVFHVGQVGGERKAKLLGGARALLMPLRWEEPFGLVMIEAMLSGTPVIAFPRGAAPELVEHGVTGFIAGDVEEMAAILAQLARFDRAACRRRAQARFGAARMVRDYLSVYSLAAAGGLLVQGAEEPTYAE